jgi:hypothetical protein
MPAMIASAVPLGVLAVALSVAEPAGHWRMEGKPGSAVPAEGVPAAIGAVVAKPAKPDAAGSLSADVPGRFVYDPLAGRSAENTASLKPAGRLEVPVAAGDLAGGFTLEAFVKPDGIPTRTAFGFFKARRSDGAAELSAGVWYLTQYKQAYWGGRLAPAKGERVEWSTGHYVTISRLTDKTLGWRHLALVYDPQRRTVTVWLDHWQAAEQPLTAPLAFDDGPLCLGGGPDGDGVFPGLIDEVRLTRGVLSPAQFLRARDEPLTGVSFESPETVLPRSSGYIDLRSGFGAVGDGKTDDTAAFRKAFADLADKVPGAYHTLYIAPGTYVVSDMTRFSRFFVVQGAGRDKTVIRLRDDAPGFADPAKPKPVIRASSTDGPPGSNKAINGSSIGLYVFDLTLDTGKGNPGAVGIEYHSNNHGAMENVVVRSGDGAGVVGVDLTHKTNGPALLKNVSVTGFDVGMACKYAEYSLTFEHITLEGQRTAGIRNSGNLLAIRRLTSRNRVPAIVSKGGAGMITLLDSELAGGAADAIAIEAEGGLYVRNVKVGGYAHSIRKRVGTFKGFKEGSVWADGPTVDGDVAEFVGDHVVAPRGGGDAGSLKLSVEDTPAVPRGDVAKDWVSLRDFADKRSGDDWTPALQAAVDSGAASVVIPPGGYAIAGTVHLRGKLVRLAGMRSGLRRPKGFAGDAPLLAFDDPDAAKTLVIERLDLDGLLHHASPGTLVLLHTFPDKYTNAPGCGKLFGEGLMNSGWRFDHPQKVWVRQWNPEAHGPGPCIVSKGAAIWSLGFKTEYESSKLWASDGASTEILGGFIYPVNKGIPKDRPIFKNTDSAMSLIYGMSIYVAGHDLHVLDSQGGDVKEIRNAALKQIGPRFRMDLYVSRPGKP